MASTDTSTRRPLPAALRSATLCEAFAATARGRPDDVALREPGPEGVSITWAEYEARVRAIAAGLAAKGVGAGDAVALLLTNRVEFHLVDTAALHLGAATFSLRTTSPATELVGPLTDAGARIAITEAAFTATLAQAAGRAPGLTEIVSVDGGDDATTSLAALEAGGDPGFDLEGAAATVRPGTVALLVHPPGTTGTPERVQHAHRDLLSDLHATVRSAPPTVGGRVVSYLPMAHLAERCVSHYGSLVFGHEVTCCPDPTTLAAALATTRPTRLLADPRTLEQVQVAILAAVGASPALAAAVQAGRDTVDALRAGCPPQFHPGVGPEHEAVLAGLRAQLGLDALEWLGVAETPTSPEVLRLLLAVGLEVVESPALLDPPERHQPGTVSPPSPGVEVRVADDVDAPR